MGTPREWGLVSGVSDASASIGVLATWSGQYYPGPASNEQRYVNIAARQKKKMHTMQIIHLEKNEICLIKFYYPN